uniref:Scaffolding protein n=1 Tax=Siphoviridae sp. ctrEg9 TaxID=2825688 RepID=A0A8S5PH58_9CAUD|nr:MAG TPA: hypothetical protein [Siphoviridae sp. ctrEg9]DAN55877.1 MAG TPA: hypothetical protein [Caudoviricetes sp.]DAR05824.1 MAG TPA: hypothetical protein [Caudoviricetes sp.]DAR45980.1 MAG TPA: hypothetical protein [Caudoviricetes sp.]
MDKFNPADLASMLTAALEASQNTSGEAATQPVSEAEETKAEETKAVAEEIKATTPDPDTKAEDATDGLPSDPEQLRKMVKDLRKEAAKDRVAGKEKAADEARRAVLDEISKALGLSKSDEAPELTVEQLTAELAESKAAGHASALELAVYKAAGDLADPARLLDSQSFHAAVKDVDLADAEAVKNAITAFTKDHPHFAKTQAVSGASAIDKPAGSGAEKPKNLQDAIALRFS